MFRYTLYLSVFMLLLVPVSSAQVEVHEWTSLDGPYWVKGIDIAVGYSTQSPGQWYLIGSDNSSVQLFSWFESNDEWRYPSDNYPGAKKVISFKKTNIGDYSDYAFCACREDDIYKTDDGGYSWQNLNFTGSNTKFNSIEVNFDVDDPEDCVLVGCTQYGTYPSVFQTTDNGESWSEIDENYALNGLSINDLEKPSQAGGWLTAATDNGIWIYDLDDENPTWGENPVAFNGIEVFAIEPSTEHHEFMWAATDEIGGYKRLYYSYNADYPWEDYDEATFGDPAVSFNKTVKDIAVLYYRGNRQSVYIAAEEGLYLVNAVGIDEMPSVELIDFQTDPNFSHFPFKYDSPVLSADHYMASEDATIRQILVGTENNVYLITEEREEEDPYGIIDIDITEAVKGTYFSNTVAATFPDNDSNDKIVFTNSEEGIIKKYDKESGESGEGWEISGLAYALGDNNFKGTDIVADFGGANDYLLASSNGTNNGTIMFSDNGGDSWDDKNPNNDPKINCLDLDFVIGSDSAHAAGYASTVWFSKTNGQTWSTYGSFGSPEFHDILSDPDSDRDDYVYVAGNDGSTNVEVSMYNGTSWTTIESGLSSASDVNQLAKNLGDDHLYAATDIGVYKCDPTAGTVTWSPKTNGTSAVEIGSIIIDSNSLYNLLASTPPDAETPKIWASADSGRSWNELSLAEIPLETSINKLAASQDENTGFIAATNEGTYYLGNIFRVGTIFSNETWGPGKIMVNGDISIQSGCTLTVDAPCTVLVAYDFDADGSGKVANSTEIIVDGVLLAEGTSSDSIVFMSSKPSGAAAGDWWGVKVEAGAEASLKYCTIKHSDYGIAMYDTSVVSVIHCTFEDLTYTGINNSQGELSADHCVFKNMSMRGIYSYKAESVVDSCVFEACEDYGIYASNDVTLALDSTIITKCTIEADDDAILAGSYYGIKAYNIDNIRIEDNTIRTYKQGGIELYNSDAIVKDNFLKYTGNYGIYAYSYSDATINHNAFDSIGTGIYVNSYSDPTIRSCLFDSVDTGVLYYSNCTPDIGINTKGNYGNSNFEECEDYFIRQTGVGGMGQVMAEKNWFGSGTPDSTKFAGAIDYDPWLTSEPVFKINLDDYPGLPFAFGLLGNYPNPFNPSTVLSYSLSEPGFATITIYNILGQKIAAPLSGFKEAGRHSVIWDGCDDAGVPVASGVYFYRLESGYYVDTEKMMLLR